MTGQSSGDWDKKRFPSVRWPFVLVFAGLLQVGALPSSLAQNHPKALGSTEIDAHFGASHSGVSESDGFG